MATIGRPKKRLVISADDRSELVRLTNRAHVNPLLAFRARLVLARARTATNTAVARRYRTTNATVGKWRTRFIERGLAGLYDEPRVGGPRSISDAVVEAPRVRRVQSRPSTPATETLCP